MRLKKSKKLHHRNKTKNKETNDISHLYRFLVYCAAPCYEAQPRRRFLIKHLEQNGRATSSNNK